MYTEMKTTAKYFILAAGSLMLAATSTSCIDETFPTNSATSEQLGSSAKATEALLWAMPAYFNAFNCLGRADDDIRHYDWGYGSMMHIRDVMGQDMPIIESNYDQYYYWEVDKYMGEDYVFASVTWRYYYKLIQTANNLIGAIDEESASDLQLSYLGAAYAFRALGYLDAAQMYEFKENKMTDPQVNDTVNVLGLTIPVITPETTEADARVNPRLPHADMVKFIEADLNKAEEYIQLGGRLSKTLPDLTAVYGLKARLYLWDEDYAQAEQYAHKAIALGNNKPMTEEEWLNPTTGFNKLSTSSWIWGSQCSKEDDVVQSGIINWTSWMAPEAGYGYAGAGPMPMIDAKLYSQIDDRDWRKLAFIAPLGTSLEGMNTLAPTADMTDNGVYYLMVADEENPDAAAYVGIKFRANEGNLTDYNTGSASAFPVMRIEEMYLIEAEAAAHQDMARGTQLINDFMQTYRYAEYECNATSADAVVREIIKQKRVELWGEGLLFFDFKRLNLDIVRDYEGSNWYEESAVNTEGRPAWMNFVITRNEKQNNDKINGANNPDPSEVYGN